MSETASNSRITKKRLELFLQRLERPERYDIALEQYVTDPVVASSILFLAHGNGDIDGKIVADLGSGSGIFACGAALLGARSVYAVEIDKGLIGLLSNNSKGLPVKVVNSPVEEFSQKVDTVIMNPPFGSVQPGSDRVFLEKAVEVSGRIYSIHNVKSRDWVEQFYSSRGRILSTINLNIAVPHIYPHHTRKTRDIEAIAFVVEVKR